LPIRRLSVAGSEHREKIGEEIDQHGETIRNYGGRCKG
jgi:hypothetical protein